MKAVYVIFHYTPSLSGANLDTDARDADGQPKGRLIATAVENPDNILSVDDALTMRAMLKGRITKEVTHDDAVRAFGSYYVVPLREAALDSYDAARKVA